MTLDATANQKSYMLNTINYSSSSQNQFSVLSFRVGSKNVKIGQTRNRLKNDPSLQIEKKQLAVIMLTPKSAGSNMFHMLFLQIFVVVPFSMLVNLEKTMCLGDIRSNGDLAWKIPENPADLIKKKLIRRAELL